MKLDATIMRYMTKEEFRVLTAIEMGMRNHELVPVPLIESIAKLNRGGTFKIISNLLKHKLLAHENKSYDGYRLTYKGYDFLALRALAARGIVVGVGRRLGVGKESDVHYCQGPNGEQYAMKLHRLGRISFRAIKSKRDYMQHRAHGSWMYMARLAATKEFAYMKALYDEGFPVPTPIDQNRHVVVMSLLDATPMSSIRDMPNPHAVLEKLMRLLIRLGRAGIVHGDFNEFNLMIGAEQKVTLIDFPQIVHLNHPNAREYFDRDVKSTIEYFRKKCDLEVIKFPLFDEVLAEVAGDSGAVLKSLNVQGVNSKDDALLVAAHGSASDNINERSSAPGDGDDEDDSDDEEDEGEAKNGQAADGLAALVPEGGCRELGELGEEMDGSLEAEAAQEASTEADTPETAAATQEGNEDSSDEESGDEGSADSDAPNQVSIASGKKTRKRQSAKEARKNLQRQQKTKPAKANNQKVRETRNAKHQVKEFVRDCL